VPEVGPLLVNLGATLIAAVVVVLVAFAFGVAGGKHRVIDVFWGIGFVVVGLTGLVLSAGYGDPTRRWLVAALTAVWGLRLATHIGLRGRGEPEDPRYEAMLARARGDRNRYALRQVYLLQGVSLWFISFPVQVAQYDPDPLTVVSYVGIAVFAVGLFFESVGDLQLARFKADPSSRGKVLDHGLWRYTRHPNYFGDACVWWGLWLVAADSWLGLATVFCPLVMNYLLVKKTGKPLLEAHLSKTRPGYADYVRRTSGFFPWPPRRHGPVDTGTEAA
jgi:steroid 5-alpha reductase family enzyme